MNKTILIISGIVLILLVLGVWAYLFVFGAPEKASDIFANFGRGDSVNQPITEQIPGTETPSTPDPKGSQKLRQLSTRSVAGAVFVDDGVRLMERGTGHLYDISLEGGAETLVTGTTIPKVIDATFSESGSRVAFTREEDGGYVISAGTITKANNGGGTLDSIVLPDGAKDPSFNSTGEEIRFLKIATGGASGHTYNLAKKIETTLFTLPLQDVEALWGDDRTYVYTTPSHDSIGYIYEIVKGTPSYVMSGKYGLMGVLWAGGALVTYLEENNLNSYLLTDQGLKKQPTTLLEEKCVPDPIETQYIYCTAPAETLGSQFPDAWYKGIVSFSDYLWKIDLGFQEAELISNFATESGREIDVEKIGIHTDGTKLYFINKNDHTLWLYDLAL